MFLTGLCFVTVTVIVKYIGDAVPPAQAAFLRYLLGLVFLLPLLRGFSGLRLSRLDWGLFSLRGGVHSIGVILWFYAMTQIPIAEVTAMNYLSPIYIALGAALFLGERLAARRIMAIVAALLGALIILRPGFREISPGHLAMMGTAVLFAISYLIAKRMSAKASAGVLVTMLSVAVTIGLAPFAAVVWVTPTPEQLLWLLLLAAVATGGHFTMSLAFAAAPMTVTQPVTFLQLIWATALGMILFGEAADIWVLLGGGIIMASVSFITWREAMLRRRAVTPSPDATRL